tara:strand:- start:44 stop:349 length:306 start_codon:yes stop_codon:yes gene_type:complete
VEAVVELEEQVVMLAVVKVELVELVFQVVLQDQQYLTVVEVVEELLHQVQVDQVLLVERVEMVVEAVQVQRELPIEVVEVELVVEMVVELEVEIQEVQVLW